MTNILNELALLFSWSVITKCYECGLKLLCLKKFWRGKFINMKTERDVFIQPFIYCRDIWMRAPECQWDDVVVGLDCLLYTARVSMPAYYVLIHHWNVHPLEQQGTFQWISQQPMMVDLCYNVPNTPPKDNKSLYDQTAPTLEKMFYEYRGL